MEKLLEFIVSYIGEILLSKKGSIYIRLFQIFILVIVFIVLATLAYRGYLNKGENLVFKEISVFSFYAIVVMIFFGIVSIGGLKNLEIKNDKEEIENYINLFEKGIDCNGEKDSNYINYFNKNKKILVVYKKPYDYEINIWLEKGQYFGMVYVYLVNNKYSEKIKKLGNLLVQDTNKGFEDCFNYNKSIDKLSDIPEIIFNIKNELDNL